MERNERFEQAINYLKMACLIKDQKDIAPKMKADPSNISRAVKGVKNNPTDSFLKRFNSAYGNIFNVNWLLKGEGNMILEGSKLSPVYSSSTRPRVPYTVAAGKLTDALEGITEEQCERIPVINALPEYDFTIIVKGDSMEPKYEGGDEIACKRIDDTSFIQWGKVHVLDTAQGLILKRIYEEGDKIKCVSYNKDYPDFSIDKREIYSMNLVVGLVRI
jgi:phage repressor protein C with HTH and peptisase S24 domain